jgi:hypothetical protein
VDGPHSLSAHDRKKETAVSVGNRTPIVHTIALVPNSPGLSIIHRVKECVKTDVWKLFTNALSESSLQRKGIIDKILYYPHIKQWNDGP